MKKREAVNLAKDTASRSAQVKTPESEQRMRESEQKFRALFDNAKDAIFIHDLEGRFLDVNREACERLGYSRDELLQIGARDIDIPEFAAMVPARIEEALRKGHVLFESEHQRRDGSKVPVEINASLLEAGGKTLVFSTCRDITARKQAEANQVLLTESLKILNRSGDLHSLVRDVLRLIRDRIGFDAVGLRLRQGEDCPYYQQDGFSEDFLHEENFLCAKRGDGAILRDAKGHAVLECTCGLVLSGRTDPSMSCFTKGGSCWTNRSTDLLALPREDDPRTNPRNNCIHRGYQSVGIFPIIGGEEIIGLLQLNDRREGRFTPESIAFYETLAQNIGLALQRTVAEASSHESEERFRTAFEKGAIAMCLTSLQTKLLKVNSAFCRMLGFSEAELIGLSFTQITHPEDVAANLAGLQRIISGKIPSFRMEKRYICKDGRLIWADMSTAAVHDAQGRPSYIVTHVQDITERKRAEKALEEERALYKDLVNAQPTGVYRVRGLPQHKIQENDWLSAATAPFRFEMVSDRFCEILGVSRESLEENPGIIIDLIHPDDKADFARRNLAATFNAPFRWEGRMVIAGETKWLHFESLGRPLESGEQRWTGVLYDITERKRVEDALRESEKRFSTAFAASPDAIILARLEDGTIREVNESFVRLFGFEAHEVIGKRSTELGLLTAAERERALQQLKKEGRLQNYEMPVRTRSGETRWTLCSIEPIELSGEPLLLSVARDITERKRAEEALRRSEASLAQAVGVAGLGIFEHDHRSGVIDYSPVMREMVGFGRDEQITLEAVLKQVAPEDREALGAAIRQAHNPAGDGKFGLEYRVALPDGHIRWISKQAQTFFEGEGTERRPVRTIGAALDVTERKEAQASLERLVGQRTAKLQEMVGELEHFSYTITHDMRAPLRAMQGFGNMLLEDCADTPQRGEFVRRIVDSAARMDNLITDALNYSKVVQQELALGPVDAAKLLHGMVESYPQFQPPQAEVIIEGNIPVVMANNAGLTQCFSNLLSNAVKFVEPGKVPKIRIWAEVSHLNPNPLTQPSTLNPQLVRLWFEDNGIGIAQEHHDLIFTMFQQLDKDYEGTGIGLALVRKVVERMQGKVGVESKEGQGSRFWIELKRAQ